MKQRNSKSTKNFTKAVGFIEDLCWLLDSQKSINYNDVLNILNQLKSQANEINKTSTNELIGILPQLLTDKSLFSSNRALSQFSSEILNIKILNWEKRSRHEMIGVIICKVQENPEIADGISEYMLTNILKNKEKIRNYRIEVEKSNNQFLWNDAIHKIVEMEKN